MRISNMFRPFDAEASLAAEQSKESFATAGPDNVTPASPSGISLEERVRQQQLESDDTRRKMFFTLLNLSLCHNVVIQRRKLSDDEDAPEENKMEAQSPDELALICGAKLFGFDFTARPSPQIVRLNLTTEFAREMFPFYVPEEGVTLPVPSLSQQMPTSATSVQPT